MNDLEISKRLALAIGWKEDQLEIYGDIHWGEHEEWRASSTTCMYLGPDNKCYHPDVRSELCVLSKPSKPGVYTVCKLEHGIEAFIRIQTLKS